MRHAKGQITKKEGANVWPHEQKTAEALAEQGYTVEFIRRSEEQRARSADAIINGELWEMKAPRSNKTSAVDKNVRKALHQARCVVFDSRRMKNVPDVTVERELRKCANTLGSIKRLLFVNLKGQVIDIK